MIAQIIDDRFTILFKEKIAVKIGKGGINNGFIAEDALKRAHHTLKHFRNLIDGENISEIYAFATSAIRNAANGQDFVTSIRKKYEISIQVISGDQEAELIYEGIKKAVSLDETPSLMMDIGGGSVEFIIGNAQEIFWKQSFEIGAQRLLDLFHYHDPILLEEIINLNEYLQEKLTPLLNAINTYNPQKLIGSSGTFDTLTDIYFQEMGFEKDYKKPTYTLPVSNYRDIYNEFITKTREERLEIPGMIPMRVDMIVVAGALTTFILEQIKVDEIICSNYALKEGILAQVISGKLLASSN
ncbi:Ppx/GppA phosphatase family protein [Penaeicola halotolerans]|uniref:Ppx/GppA phosphatase family protein n=1 Tax=Penaeicola halotolerans TaxID=2793196 RepID=UPI00293D5F8E|nr:exopolyphosphatase [Penaeicola halotolerans]